MPMLHPDKLKTLWADRLGIRSQLENLANATQGREPTASELTQEKQLAGQLDELDRKLAGEIDGLEREQRAEDAFARYAAMTGGRLAPAPMSQQDKDLDQRFREAILEKRSGPIDVYDEHPRMYYQPGLEYERRDLLKTTATQALPVSVFSRIIDHLVESTAVLRAGATVVTTATGEDLQVPKSTAFSSSQITAEGAAITESDPTLGVAILKAHKYASFFQVGYELAQDGSTDLLGFLARQAALSLAQAYGPHLVAGTGTGQPRGIVTDATVGQTGPTGTSTTFGTQTTAGQGLDLIIGLIGSILEPYTVNGRFLMSNAAKTTLMKLRDGQSRYVYEGGDLKGYPNHVDPGVATPAANAKSVLYGDFTRYFVRIVNGIRFERSDEFAFQNDLISFKCVIRLDGALVDTNAIKVFQHSAT